MNHFYKKFTFTFLVFCLLFSSNLKAQSASFTPEHLKAAQDFIEAINAKPSYQNAIESLIKYQAAKVPEDKRAIFEEVMRDFANKYFTWDLVNNRIAKVYADEFTTEELQQLTTFYNSPVGKK